jgi:glycosyltransferase involved in cell wall biosynthesis
MDPLLSIIVPTYNEERKQDLFEFLGSVAKQTYQNIQTIVVVEKSRTFYNALLNYIQDNGLSVETIFSDGLKGISYSRNLGIEHASGDIIAITDDDAILSTDWAKTLVETYAKYPEAIGVTGEALPLWISSTDSWFPTALYWMIGCTSFRGWESEKPTNVTSGVNMSFRAEVFSVEKFPLALGGGASAQGKLGFPNEDNDFALKITRLMKRPIIYNPKVKVFHKVYPHRLQNKYIRKYAFWQGCAEARYSDMWYSKTERKPLRFNLVKELSTDVLRSFFLNYKVAIKKLKVVIPTFVFFGVGYASYKLCIYKHLSVIM